MKDNHNNSIKAVIIIGIMIVFCIVSVLFFNKETSTTNPVLAIQNKLETTEETTRTATTGTAPIQFYNNFGGSNDETLLDSKIIGEHIYLLCESNSIDKDLTKNTGSICIYFQKLSLNCDLLETHAILSVETIFNAKIINYDAVILYQYDNQNYEYRYNILSNTSTTTTLSYNINQCLFFDNNIITTEINENYQNLYLNHQPITIISTNHKIIKIYTFNNNSYICFDNLGTIELFSIEERNTVLSFENSKTISVDIIENDLFISLFTENKVIILKLNSNYEIMFSTELDNKPIDNISIIKMPNGYNIFGSYKAEKQSILSYFLCQHGDLISTSNHTFSDIKNILKISTTNNSLIISATTNADNFITQTITPSFEIKKQVVLNTNTTCENFMIINDENMTYICLTTTANNLEFSNNFGKNDVFVFKTDYIL